MATPQDLYDETATWWRKPVAEGGAGQTTALREFTPSGDNTDTLNTVVAYACSAREALHFDGQFYPCEDSIFIRGQGFAKLHGPGGWSRTTDEGLKNNARNNAHLRVIDSTDVELHGLELIGAHTIDEPARSEASEWEAQHFVWLQTVKRVKLCGVNLTDGWGDFVSCSSSTPNGPPCEDVTITGGNWRHNGRMGVLANGVNRLRWYGTKVSRLASSCYHVESGERVGDPVRGYQSDHRVQRISLLSGGKAFAHITGDAGLRGLLLQGNLRRGNWVSLYCDGSGRLPDGSARIRDVSVLENFHDRAAPGGYYMLFDTIDGVTHQYNEGPLRSNYTIAQQIVRRDCRGVRVGPNDLWRVVGGKRVYT